MFHQDVLSEISKYLLSADLKNLQFAFPDLKVYEFYFKSKNIENRFFAKIEKFVQYRVFLLLLFDDLEFRRKVLFPYFKQKKIKFWPGDKQKMVIDLHPVCFVRMIKMIDIPVNSIFTLPSFSRIGFEINYPIGNYHLLSDLYLKYSKRHSYYQWPTEFQKIKQSFLIQEIFSNNSGRIFGSEIKFLFSFVRYDKNDFNLLFSNKDFVIIYFNLNERNRTKLLAQIREFLENIPSFGDKPGCQNILKFYRLVNSEPKFSPKQIIRMMN